MPKRDPRVYREKLSLTVAARDNSCGSGAQGHCNTLAIDYGLQTHQHFRRPVESKICFSSEHLTDPKAQLRVLGYRPEGSLFERKPRWMLASLHRSHAMDSVTRPELVTVCSDEISKIRVHARDMRVSVTKHQ